MQQALQFDVLRSAKIKPFTVFILLTPLLYSSSFLFPVVASSDNDGDYGNDYFEEDFEEDNSIHLCCAWGSNLGDGTLTYYIDHESSAEEQEAIRSAVEEWDSNIKINFLELEGLSGDKNSDIRIKFQDESEEIIEGEEIAGQTVTSFDQYGLLESAEITISRSIEAFDFDTSTIEQVAKHEIGHALGLGHANFEGNLMAERINDGTDTVSDCEIKAVIETNYWELGENDADIGITNPGYPPGESTTCDVDEDW